MLLTPDDAALFYQAWGSILVWVNEQRHVVPPFPAPTPGHPIEPPITNQLRKVLWADDIWLGCAGPGPALAPFGAGMHDFSPNAIRASQDRVRLRGHAYCGRSGVAEPAAGAVIELVESTSDRLIESTRTDCAGYFELAASRASLEAGELAVRFSGTTNRLSGSADDALELVGSCSPIAPTSTFDCVAPEADANDQVGRVNENH